MPRPTRAFPTIITVNLAIDVPIDQMTSHGVLVSIDQPHVTESMIFSATMVIVTQVVDAIDSSAVRFTKMNTCVIMAALRGEE